MLTDTHCHLDMFKDVENTLVKAKAHGVTRIITIGIDLPSSRKAIELAERYNFVWATVGVHPHEAKTLDESKYAELEELGRHPRVVAIGEIGLDFYRNLSPKQAQLLAFKKQIKLAQKIGKPIIIHCREAISETWEILKETNGFACGGIWHCFPGDTSLAKQCVKIGFYIAISGVVTFPKAQRLQEVVKNISLKWLLLETDAPFLAPVPKRGKRNEPAFLRYTAEKVAELKNSSLEEVALITTENAKRVLGLEV